MYVCMYIHTSPVVIKVQVSEIWRINGRMIQVLTALRNDEMPDDIQITRLMCRVSTENYGRELGWPLPRRAKGLKDREMPESHIKRHIILSFYFEQKVGRR